MTLLLTNDDLASLISPAEFVDRLDRAYRDYAVSSGICAPRIDVQSAALGPDKNYQLGLAVGMSGSYAALRVKSDVVMRRIVGGVARKDKYCTEPGKYLGLILLFEAATGALLAILHDGLLQKMRVGADSALGVRYMARRDCGVLGLLGSGGMARAHVAAVASECVLQRVQVFSPNPENREAFAREMAELHGLDVVAVDAPEKIYNDADIVSSCASAIGPVIFGRFLKPGLHITCIGGMLDDEASDRVDAALRFGLAPAPAEAPELRLEAECMTFAEGGGKAAHGGTARYANIPSSRRVEFSELLTDPSRGRTDDRQITFSERGNIHGLQFAAVAGLLYERARAANVGQELAADQFLQSIRN